jgi:hypothetical protein
MSQNPYASPSAQARPVERALAVHPTLWNPSAAALWSLLFSPIFGAVLHARNWTAIGDLPRARGQYIWAIGYGIYLCMVIAASAFLPHSRPMDSTLRFTSIGMLAAWYFMSASAQVAFVKERYGERYLRHGWGLPLLIAAGSFVLFVVAVAAVILVFGPDIPGERGSE